MSFEIWRTLLHINILSPLQQSVEVPQTPLHTSRVLQEEQDVWEKVKVSVGAVHLCFFVAAWFVLSLREIRIGFSMGLFFYLFLIILMFFAHILSFLTVTEQWNPSNLLYLKLDVLIVHTISVLVVLLGGNDKRPANNESGLWSN